jgi:D-sedoheptulose 7-phosphate isomerase
MCPSVSNLLEAELFFINKIRESAMNDFKGAAVTYFTRLTRLIEGLDYQSIDAATALIAETWRNGKQIITLGNGGSSLTALHFINDWNKSVFLKHGQPFRGRCLVDNIGLVMAYANDNSFENIFVEQLKNIMQPGDLVIAISGSGNSENVIRAVQYANENGAVTFGLCGYDGGKLKTLALHHVWVPIDDMQLSEDVHMMFGHIVMQKLCEYY